MDYIMELDILMVFFSNLAYKGYSYFTWKKVGQDEKESDEKKESLLDENDRDDQI